MDKPNGGCASARQYGLDKARGKYIGFIDPDDYIDESMFRKLLRAAMMGSYDISYCGYNEYYENTKEIRKVEGYRIVMKHRIGKKLLIWLPIAELLFGEEFIKQKC